MLLWSSITDVVELCGSSNVREDVKLTPVRQDVKTTKNVWKSEMVASHFLQVQVKSQVISCKSKSSHKSCGPVASQVKSQVIWPQVKSSHKSFGPNASQVTSHFVQVSSQVAHYFVQKYWSKKLYSKMEQALHEASVFFCYSGQLVQIAIGQIVQHVEFRTTDRRALSWNHPKTAQA